MTNEWIEKRHKDKTPIIGKKCYKVYQNRDSVCPWCPTIKTIKTGESLTEVVNLANWVVRVRAQASNRG